MDIASKVCRLREVNGISIVDGVFVRSAGAPDAPLLILLHAFAENSYCYQRMTACGLSSRFHVVAPDLWGFGATPRDPALRTVADYAGAVARWAKAYAQGRRLGWVAHSIASAIAVQATEALGPQVTGLFSIEGNLTLDDAMFTGRAAGFDDPATFKAHFLDEIWQMGQTSAALRHYFASAYVADAAALWHLGRDTARISADNRLGEAFRNLACPARYYWSKSTTPAATQAWIDGAGIDHQVYDEAGHWPMVERPQATAEAIRTFFEAFDEPSP